MSQCSTALLLSIPQSTCTGTSLARNLNVHVQLTFNHLYAVGATTAAQVPGAVLMIFPRTRLLPLKSGTAIYAGMKKRVSKLSPCCTDHLVGLEDYEAVVGKNGK